MASDFEGELDALDQRLETAQKAAESLVNGLKRSRRSVRDGNVSELVKALNALDARLADTQSAAQGLSDAWRFDTSAYVADGRLLADLRATAGDQRLELFERNGRIYCFPLILRLEPGQSAVRIGRKIERRIRPDELVKLLAKAQKSPQRFREQAFLDLLFRTYRRLVGHEWSGTGLGRVVALVEIHETLTLLPGSDYPPEEFARDLLLLDRQPDLRTRTGERFEFPHGTTTKGIKPLIVYDEQGSQRAYYGIRFGSGD
jgi:hypothetical protein